MSDRSMSEAFEAFLSEVRRILPHLYNPLKLRKTPLFSLFDVRDSNNPVSTLRQILVDAIQALEPGDDIPVHANAWRIYHILKYRYVEQSIQRTVANNMSLSVRQLRRWERDAETALASYLWSHYNLQQQAEAIFCTPTPDDELVPAGNTGLSGREREMKWIQESFPSKITDVTAMIEATLKTVGPLIQALEVRVVYEIPQDLPPIAGQRMLLRQAFLSLLTAAVHTVPGGQVRISAEQQTASIIVRLEAKKGKSSATALSGTEDIQMARQCIDRFGGEIVVEITGKGELPFVTALLLPATEHLPVLVIDDNLDTLQLFQRYLSGTRYQFHSVCRPEEALSVAESLLPNAIILDIMLPNIDGWELLGRLREHPMTQSIPIIVCTVMPQRELVLALGAADYLRKPVSREKFLSTLDRQVHSHKTGFG